MRTVREFCKAGVAGVHIEDQIFPKRAHYHKYVAHVIPIEEYVEKIQYACRERDRIDRNFLIIARTDSCRFFGLEEAAKVACGVAVKRESRVSTVYVRQAIVLALQPAGLNRHVPWITASVGGAVIGF